MKVDKQKEKKKKKKKHVPEPIRGAATPGGTALSSGKTTSASGGYSKTLLGLRHEPFLERDHPGFSVVGAICSLEGSNWAPKRIRHAVYLRVGFKPLGVKRETQVDLLRR